MKKWDTAAGILLIQESGGLISDSSGNPDCLNSDTLVFSNPKCFKHLLKAVTDS
jgi:myo-inositol-1(or 4)-monophosphatase